MFLSSLGCDEMDHSLLDDCSHDQLGLAYCEDDFGLARVKCFGKPILLNSITASELHY